MAVVKNSRVVINRVEVRRVADGAGGVAVQVEVGEPTIGTEPLLVNEYNARDLWLALGVLLADEEAPE